MGVEYLPEQRIAIKAVLYEAGIHNGYSDLDVEDAVEILRKLRIIYDRGTGQ